MVPLLVDRLDGLQLVAPALGLEILGDDLIDRLALAAAATASAMPKRVPTSGKRPKMKLFIAVALFE